MSDEKQRPTSVEGNVDPALDPDHTGKTSSFGDPLLDRLRLNDQFGKPIKDLKVFFRDCEVVGFFFATCWRVSDREAFERHVMDFTRNHPHRFKCIFVSIDETRKAFEEAVMQRPWVHMIWEDGSNANEGDPSSQPKERFLTPADHQLTREIISLVSLDPSSKPTDQCPNEKSDSYLVPFSRVALCQALDVLYSPTLMIYDIRAKRFLARNVKPSRLDTLEKRELAWEKWEKGEDLELSVAEIFYGLRYAIMIISLGVAYYIITQINPSFKLINIVETYLNSRPGAHSTIRPLPPGAAAPDRDDHHYVEFM